MNKQNMSRGRLSAVVLALSVLTGTVGATAAQARPAYDRDGASSAAWTVQQPNTHSASTQERSPDAGMYECDGFDLHTRLQRQACGGY